MKKLLILLFSIALSSCSVEVPPEAYSYVQKPMVFQKKHVVCEINPFLDKSTIQIDDMDDREGKCVAAPYHTIKFLGNISPGTQYHIVRIDTNNVDYYWYVIEIDSGPLANTQVILFDARPEQLAKF